MQAARSDLRAVEDDLEDGEILDPASVERLRDIASDLAAAEDRISNPLVSPVRHAPVLGRQLRSVEAVAAAAKRVTDVSADTLHEAQIVVEAVDDGSTGRIQAIRTLGRLSDDATQQLRSIETGPAEALFDPVADARAELREEIERLVELLDRMNAASVGLADLLDGPHCYLLFGANNAEMRAGSGMFLQAGEVCFDDGRISLADMGSTADLTLPPDAVEIRDRDLAARWGLLLPNAEWRNLALSPRFDVSAELAVEMWRHATGRRVDGVIAVDPIALEAILEATGRITVDGEDYDASDVVEQLLVRQYEGFLDEDYDADARRDRLGDVASATLHALDAGDWDARTLVEELPDATQGRHLLAWSSDPAVQRAFRIMGVDGIPARNSVAVNVLNRGGGSGGAKLDPELEVAVAWSSRAPRAGRRQAEIQVRLHNTVEEGTPTYVESPDAEGVRFGVYQGILTVHVPGSASDLTVDHGQGEIYTVGPDGPMQVIGVLFDLPAEQRATFTVRFSLPERLDEVVVESSARWPAVEWRTPRDRFEDDSPEVIEL